MPHNRFPRSLFPLNRLRNRFPRNRFPRNRLRDRTRDRLRDRLRENTRQRLSRSWLYRILRIPRHPNSASWLQLPQCRLPHLPRGFQSLRRPPTKVRLALPKDFVPAGGNEVRRQ